jgi:hypothetical protein
MPSPPGTALRVTQRNLRKRPWAGPDIGSAAHFVTTTGVHDEIEDPAPGKTAAAGRSTQRFAAIEALRQRRFILANHPVTVDVRVAGNGFSSGTHHHHVLSSRSGGLAAIRELR